MDQSYSYRKACDTMRARTCVVIPVCFPSHIERGQGEALLRDTVGSYVDQVDDPKSVCLSVDGEELGADVANRVADVYGASCCIAPVNRGKFWAARNGMQQLLAAGTFRYLAIVDQDGDHFANELLNFVRSAEHIREVGGHERVMVLGRRVSRHHPMGMLRGELEELADRVLLDALYYHASVTGHPLAMEYAFLLDEFPDFHSGYKLFSRASAEDVFLSEPEMAGVPDICYYRHGVEAVMSVEAIVRGAYLGIVNRTTFNEQPISTFGAMDRCQLVADKMIWPLKRLEVPPAFVRQWLANHLARLLLDTLAPHGRSELEQIAELVLDACDALEEGGTKDFLRPLFL